MSNGAYTIGSSANQGQLGMMVGVGIPATYEGDFSGSLYGPTGPSDYAVNQAYSTVGGGLASYSPYQGQLTATLMGPVDNSAGSTAAYDPTALFGGGGMYSPTTPAAAGTTGSATASGTPVTVGVTPTLGSWLNAVGTDLTGWFTRGFLIVIGLVIVAIGVVYVMRK